MYDDELDCTKLKYVLYARKSEADESRQIRSIQDQISDCNKLASLRGLKVVEVVKEEKSAKKPNQRPKFNQMIEDLRRRKYDGILSWNPDRLSRNMKEGGELIDMLDEGLIMDLKFVTHPFVNNANGKMLLGMAFVLSKQYSDDLSQKITRGVNYQLAEGKTGTPKHGYVKDKQNYYRPDGKNWQLIKSAWEMRAEGKPLREITSFMNDEGYGKRIARTGRRVVITNQILSDIFKDPFYYGFLSQANKLVDLTAIYDFIPATTKDVYDAVQAQGRIILPVKQRKVFYPLQRMVLCSFCKSYCLVGASSGAHGGKYLYFRCDNPDCSRVKNKIPRSVRGKIVLDFINDFLKDGLGLTESDYNLYRSQILKQNDEDRSRLKVELHSKTGALNHIKSEIEKMSLGLPNIADNKRALEINKKRINELEGQESGLVEEISTIKEKLDGTPVDNLTIESFLNLSKNAGIVVKNGDERMKDTICRAIFLNLEVGDKKVTEYRLKEPFSTLMRSKSLVSCGDGGS